MANTKFEEIWAQNVDFQISKSWGARTQKNVKNTRSGQILTPFIWLCRGNNFQSGDISIIGPTYRLIGGALSTKK